MSNKDFIREYGKLEFYDMCNYMYQELHLARIDKTVHPFKINNSKKRVTFFLENNERVVLDFATIYNVGVSNLKKHIERGVR